MTQVNETAQAPQNGHKKRSWHWLFSLLSGAVMALAFEPYDIGFIVWVGLLPILTILWTGPAKFWRGFFMAWLFGMGWYGVSFWWIHEVSYVFNIPLWLFLIIAFLPLMAVYAAMLGLWGGLVATVMRPRLEKGPNDADFKRSTKLEAWNKWATRDTFSTVKAASGVAGALVCAEWLRSSGTLAFSWNTLGMGLYDGLSLAQWAEFVGTTALSFIPAFVAVVLWGAGRRSYLYMRGAKSHCRIWDFYATMLVVFLLFIGGMFISKAYSQNSLLSKDSTIPLPVLAVQINKDQQEKIQERLLGKNEGNGQLISATTQASEEILQKQMKKAFANEQDLAFPIYQPAWVIWPESALSFPLCIDADTKQYLDRQYQSAIDFLTNEFPQLRHPVVLFAGADEYRYKADAQNRLVREGMLNSMVCFTGTDFDHVQSASKQHLMPFGEYIPLADSCEWLRQIYAEVTGTQVGDGIHPGTGNEPMVVPVPNRNESIGVIPAVCYEDTVGTELTKFVRKGPQVIVNISNDAWFRNSACGAQQARNAAFRCIELRRPMIRAANMGYCCAIAPNGAIIDAQEDPHAPGHSFAVLPVDRNAGFTVFAVFGDWAVVVCLLIVLAQLTVYIIRKKTSLC